MDMAKALLKDRGLPNSFQAEVVSTAVYIFNITLTNALKNKTPYQAWYGYKPTVSHLWVFGCISYPLIPSQKLQKFDTKSEKCVIIGYCTNTKTYRLFNPATSKIIVSRDVTFHEATGWNWNMNGKIDATPLIMYEDALEEMCNPADKANLVPRPSSTTDGENRGVAVLGNNNNDGSDGEGTSSD